MTGFRINVKKAIVGGFVDRVLLSPGGDPIVELREQVIQGLDTQIEVTVSGVTMHLAAWSDPEHWSDDWREHAGDDDPTDYVLGLLSAATEEVAAL